MASCLWATQESVESAARPPLEIRRDARREGDRKRRRRLKRRRRKKRNGPGRHKRLPVGRRTSVSTRQAAAGCHYLGMTVLTMVA